MKIYGWSEIDEACYGLETTKILPNEVCSEDIETGELSLNCVEGWWFKTFSQAKKAYVQAIRLQINWRKEALTQAKQTRKKELI